MQISNSYGENTSCVHSLVGVAESFGFKRHSETAFPITRTRHMRMSIWFAFEQIAMDVLYRGWTRSNNKRTRCSHHTTFTITDWWIQKIWSLHKTRHNAVKEWSVCTPKSENSVLQRFADSPSNKYTIGFGWIRYSTRKVWNILRVKKMQPIQVQKAQILADADYPLGYSSYAGCSMPHRTIDRFPPLFSLRWRLLYERRRSQQKNAHKLLFENPHISLVESGTQFQH